MDSEWSSILENGDGTIKECKKTIEEINKIVGAILESDDSIVARMKKMEREGDMEKDVFEFIVKLVNRRTSIRMKMDTMDKKKKVPRMKSSFLTSSGTKKRVRFIDPR